MTDTRVGSLLELSKSLFNTTERSNMEAIWKDIAEFVLPSQFNLFNEEISPGQKRTERLFDATAIQANHDLAASIHSTLTNPSSKWSDMRFKTHELNDDPELTSWIEEVNTRMHGSLNESNFYTELAKDYPSITSLGTMVLMQEDANRGGDQFFQGFRFKSVHLGELAIAEDADGNVNTLCRRFKLTAKQALERFGDVVSEDIKNAVDSEKHLEMFEFMLVIQERDDKDVHLNELGLAPPNARPIESVVIEVKRKIIVEEDGFYEQPFHAARWQTMPGEVYGRSPAHIALPDVRTLNKLVEMTLKYIEKVVNPPILVKDRAAIGNLELTPGKASVVRSFEDIKAFIPDARPDLANFKISELKESINNIFFLNRIFLPDRTQIGEMTATETLKRIEQTQKVLGSTWGVLNNFLSGIVVRSFKMMLRGGALPPLPQRLQDEGVDIEINFINSLARAQQSDDIANIESWVQGIAFLAQIKPEVVDVIDADSVAKHIARIRNVPELAIVDEETVDAIREQRAQAEAAEREADNNLKRADAASKSGSQGGLDETQPS